MTTYEMIALFGVPTVMLGIYAALWKLIKKIIDDNKATKKGIQALLRSRMISEWNSWSEKGYAPIYARQNFENCWLQYHELGANGVMDDIHARFFELPTEPPTHAKAGE